MDGASTEMYEEAVKQGRTGEYLFWKSGEYKTSDAMIDYWAELCDRYPVYSIDRLAKINGTPWTTDTTGWR